MIYNYAGILTDGQSARAKVRRVVKAGWRTGFRGLDIDEGGVAAVSEIRAMQTALGLVAVDTGASMSLTDEAFHGCRVAFTESGR